MKNIREILYKISDNSKVIEANLNNEKIGIEELASIIYNSDLEINRKLDLIKELNIRTRSNIKYGDHLNKYVDLISPYNAYNIVRFGEIVDVYWDCKFNITSNMDSLGYSDSFRYFYHEENNIIIEEYVNLFDIYPCIDYDKFEVNHIIYRLMNNKIKD